MYHPSKSYSNICKYHCAAPVCMWYGCMSVRWAQIRLPEKREICGDSWCCTTVSIYAYPYRMTPLAYCSPELSTEGFEFDSSTWVEFPLGLASVHLQMTQLNWYTIRRIVNYSQVGCGMVVIYVVISYHKYYENKLLYIIHHNIYHTLSSTVEWLFNQ